MSRLRDHRNGTSGYKKIDRPDRTRKKPHQNFPFGMTGYAPRTTDNPVKIRIAKRG